MKVCPRSKCGNKRTSVVNALLDGIHLPLRSKLKTSMPHLHVDLCSCPNTGDLYALGAGSTCAWSPSGMYIA